MTAPENVSEEELKAHNCFEAVDRVSGDPETTAFKRRARLQQALWREKKGLSMGSQPMRPKLSEQSRALGSRIAVDSAKNSLANFLNDDIRRAVIDRVSSRWQRRDLPDRCPLMP